MKLKIIAATALIVFSALIYFYSPLSKPTSPKSVTVTPTATPTTSAVFPDRIYPGTTKVADLLKIKGEPTTKTVFNNQTVYHYQSTVPNWFTQFYLQADVVKLIIEPIFAGDQRTKDILFQKYGTPPLILFGDLSPAGKDLFVYPSLGVATLASNYTNIVYEIWYFPSMTKDDFISSIAIPHNYALSPPESKE